MKKYIFLAMFFVMCSASYADVNINIGVSIPGVAVTTQAQPSLIIIPDTPDVYAVPDVNVDVYFWGGMWWKLSEGRWYKSPEYNNNWIIINTAPSFYGNMNHHWKKDYSRGTWNGRPWNPEKVKYEDARKGKGHNDKYLEEGKDHKKGKGHYKD